MRVKTTIIVDSWDREKYPCWLAEDEGERKEKNSTTPSMEEQFESKKKEKHWKVQGHEQKKGGKLFVSPFFNDMSKYSQEDPLFLSVTVQVL